MCRVAASARSATIKPAGMSQLKTVLQHDNYDSQAITLLDKNAVPSDCRVFVDSRTEERLHAQRNHGVQELRTGRRQRLFALDPPLDLQHEHIAAEQGSDGLACELGREARKTTSFSSRTRRALTADLGPVFPLVMNYGSQPHHG